MRWTALLVVTAIALVGARSAGADTGHLVGTDGPGFTIGLTDANGNPVRQVVAGTYQILVHDLSDQHNFVLGEKATGDRPVQTEVPFVGDMTFTVTLRPGLWVYACSAHWQTMNGELFVVPATLTAWLTSRGAASLSVSATAVGSYTVTVLDRSRTQGFRLVGPGVKRSTGKAFTGKATWTVQLAAGTYRFGGAHLTGTVVVSS